MGRASSDQRTLSSRWYSSLTRVTIRNDSRKAAIILGALEYALHAGHFRYGNPR
jgi:hypothetical protein